MNSVIVPERPAIALNVGVMGRFKFIRRRGDESVIEETPFGKNHFLDNGLDLIMGRDFGGNNGLEGCHVGSGNTPPTDDDQSLESFVAGTSTILSTNGSTDVVDRVTRVYTTFRFDVGQAAGNLSEVGISIGWSSGGNNAANPDRPLATRALITDQFGDPTTISPQPDEILDVVWEFSKYAPSADVEGTFEQEIDGSMQVFNYAVRPAHVSSGNWPATRSLFSPTIGGGNLAINGSGASASGLGAAYSFPGNPSDAATSYSVIEPYVPGTFYVDTRLSFSLTAGNMNMRTFKFNNTNSAWQMEIDPVVQKVPQKQYYVDIRNMVGRYSP